MNQPQPPELSVLAEEIDGIGDLIAALGQRHMDPERFHLDKDDAVRRCRRLAGRLRKGAPRKTTVAERRTAMAQQLGPAIRKR